MQRRTLQIIHIHPTALALQICKPGNQGASKLSHVLLMQMRGLLLQRGIHSLAQRLRVAHFWCAGELRVELARRAFFGEQTQRHISPALLSATKFELLAFGRVAFLRCRAEHARCGKQKLSLQFQELQRIIQALHLRPELRRTRNTALHHACAISQFKLDALGQRIGQRLLHAPAAYIRHRCAIRGMQRLIALEQRIKARPQGLHSLRIVFQQLVNRRQAQLFAHC